MLVIRTVGEIGETVVPKYGFKWAFEIPTWEQVYELLLNLADRIRRAKFNPDIIVAVARGGWPAARIMSDLLENPEVASVKAEFYGGVAETKGEPVITQPVSAPVKNKKVLVVDDVSDTGKSLALVREHMKEAGAADVRTATVYCKDWSTIKPDWFERKTSHWVVFPWEWKETVRRIFERCREQSVPMEQIEETLVSYGFDRKLAERLLSEIDGAKH
jgi:hypoxanthine phosphoribosyltransferase